MPFSTAGLRELWASTRQQFTQNVPDFFPIQKDFSGDRKPSPAADLRAGINVALLAFPQGLAYAAIAGLPIVYGVTCSAIAAMVAPLFAGSRITVLGPTNATAFMLFSYFATFPEQFALHWMPLIVLTVGLMLVAGAFLRVADLVQYVSRSVVVGYLAGAAVLIIVNQLRHMLGITFESAEDAPRSFFAVLWQTLRRLTDLHLPTLAVGLSSAACYLGLRRVLPRLPVFAITLLVISAATHFLGGEAAGVATYAGEAFGAKDFLPVQTLWSHPDLFHQWGQFLGLCLAIAFLASMEHSVMSQSLGSKTGRHAPKNQDMFGVGVANLACAFLSGMPASGSLTRSALNFDSGAVSRLASIVAGFLCLIGALTLGDFVRYVPKAALAALVVCIAASLINPAQIRISLNATGSDALTLLVTFLAALLVPLHVAIFAGVAVSIALYLRKASRPYLVEYEFDTSGHLSQLAGNSPRQNPAISIVHVEGELFFGAAELFRTQIQRVCHDPNLRIIVLRMKNAHHLDATSVMALDELVGYLRQEGRDIIVSGAMGDVTEVLEASGMADRIGHENIFPGNPENPTLATRDALKRAQEILGTKKADIRIFYDPSKGNEKGK